MPKVGDERRSVVLDDIVVIVSHNLSGNMLY